VLLSAGLIVAAASGLVAVARGRPYLTGQWTGTAGPEKGWDIGTVLLFDTGVYLVVLGTVLLIVFTLAEEER
jgi:multicomponent Na+:H+ antiporter subunit B